MVSILVSACVSNVVDDTSVLINMENARSDRLVKSYQDSGVFFNSAQFNQLSRLVLARLYPDDPEVYQIKLARVAEDNAYALPTNVIIIHAGLLASMRSEDQFAFVVAHELAHIQAGHSYRAAHLRRSSRIKAQLGDILSFGSGYAFQHYASRLRKESRRQELEADKTAARLVSRAGYDLQKAENFFEQLASQSSVKETERADGTHPALTSRRRLLSHYRRTAEEGTPELETSNRFLFENVRKQVMPLVIEDKIAADDLLAALQYVDTLADVAGESATTHCYRGTILTSIAENDPELYVTPLKHYRVFNVVAQQELPRVYEEETARDSFAIAAQSEFQHILSAEQKTTEKQVVGSISSYSCALRGMGMAYYMTGDSDNANRYLTRYLKQDPTVVDSRYIKRLMSNH